MKKRILACLLALMMIIGILPVMALADNTVVMPDDLAAAVPLHRAAIQFILAMERTHCMARMELLEARA